MTAPGGRRAALAFVAATLLSCGEPATTPGPSPAASGGAGSMAFVDVTNASGIALLNVNGNVDRKPTILESLGQGAAAFDYDGDGALDIFVCNGSTLFGEPKGADPHTELYRQVAPLRFEPAGERAGLKLRGWFQGAYAADYDGDGRVDLFLTSFGRSRLLRNKGDGAFEDVTDKTGTGIDRWTSGAAFFDADGDGDLDLFVARYVRFDVDDLPNGGKPCAYRGLAVACGPHGLPADQNVFLENQGGVFVDATARFGFDRGPHAYGLGVVAFDFDTDGDVDLFVANDSTANDLWENRGGKFVEVAGSRGCDLAEGAKAQSGMGTDAADADLDGWPDLFITNFENDTNTLYLGIQQGSLRGFIDATATSGVGPPSFANLGWGTRILDFDRDGWPDIAIANGHIYPQVDGSGLDTTYRQKNQILRGAGRDAKGRIRFEDVHPPGGFFDQVGVGRGLVAADFDDDGDQDLFIVEIDGQPRLGRNDTQTTGNWIGVVLEGRAPNTDAIGATLTIEDSAGVTRRVERTSGAGFYSTSDKRLWTALGTATIKNAEVRWPDGKTTPIPAASLNRYVRANQTTGAVSDWKRP